LQSYNKKFNFFFNDIETQNFADPVFVRKILSNLDCSIYLQGTEIVEYGKPFKELFLNYREGVTVVDATFQFKITEYPEESFFGDYQILLGTVARYRYVATPHKGTTTWCMIVPADKFIRICNQFPEFRSFLTVRGIKRRAHLMKTYNSMHKMFFLKSYTSTTLVSKFTNSLK
jgi:signal-transduction protein with cAMP-binding, CBS, and nucleotidyltransferase domain